jgi:hypothetical protein
MKIECDKPVVLVEISELKLDPKNRNKHPADQIKRLAEILKAHGWRYPVKVSNQSGFVRSGHGRIEAAKLNGWTHVPVQYQDYDNMEEEYADSVADNAIASWAELDLSGINSDLADLGPDFNIDLLGIKDFVLEPLDKLMEDANKKTLSEKFLVPPFTVLDARQGYWQDRKRQWLSLGIQSELGRGGGITWGVADPDADGGTLGAIAPNQNAILKRQGKYA